MSRFGVAVVVLALLASAGCATGGGEPADHIWTAHGYLSPGASEPEIIGTYPARDDCEAAVDDWMSRQVVGNPVSGECLPVDRR